MTRRLGPWLSVAALLVPVAAPAQEVRPENDAHPRAATATAAPQDTRVFVTLRAGGPVLEGSLLDLGADAVALLTAHGPRVLPLPEVTRIQRAGDSSRDGAITGALILGLACVLRCGQGTTGPGHHARVVAANAALGALFGWLFDGGHAGRTTIYPATRASSPRGGARPGATAPDRDRSPVSSACRRPPGAGCPPR